MMVRHGYVCVLLDWDFSHIVGLRLFCLADLLACLIGSDAKSSISKQDWGEKRVAQGVERFAV